MKSHLEEARVKITELETEAAAPKGVESTTGSVAPAAESGEQVSQSEETIE